MLWLGTNHFEEIFMNFYFYRLYHIMSVIHFYGCKGQVVLVLIVVWGRLCHH